MSTSSSRSSDSALFDAPAAVEMRAHISDCGRYRYSLSRTWDRDLPVVLFVGLNPSTADAEQDDPTIRRCIRFARDWGYGGLGMLNLFAWRATDPHELAVADDPVGPENDHTLKIATLFVRARGGLVVAAWGAHKRAAERAAAVLPLLGDLHALGLTAGGAPRHPLYMPAASRPVPYDTACRSRH